LGEKSQALHLAYRDDTLGRSGARNCQSGKINEHQCSKSGFIMRTPVPTAEEIQALVSFLPQLYAKDFTSVHRWAGTSERRDRTVSLPWPEYDDLVTEFFQLASTECWTDHEYDPETAGENLNDANAVQSADLDQLKAMLTYCVRGEKFCDGHWGAMIEGGQIRRVLERLDQLL
jgi:hypothetical protein